MDCRAGARRDDADYRNAEQLLGKGQGGGGRRVAGDHHDLDRMGLKPAPCLDSEGAHLIFRTRTIRAALGVAHVVDRLVRQRLSDGASNGKSAQARVEHADGQRVERDVLHIQCMHLFLHDLSVSLKTLPDERARAGDSHPARTPTVWRRAAPS